MIDLSKDEARKAVREDGFVAITIESDRERQRAVGWFRFGAEWEGRPVPIRSRLIDGRLLVFYDPARIDAAAAEAAIQAEREGAS